jgi:hypothetical protein
VKTLHSLTPLPRYPRITSAQLDGLSGFLSRHSEHPVTVTRESPPRFYYRYMGGNTFEYFNPEDFRRTGITRRFNWSDVSIVDNI